LLAFLHGSNAWAQNTLAAAIWKQYRVPAVLPFAAFEQDSPAAPLPGSAIAGLSQRSFDGVSTYDLSAAVICTLQYFAYPKFRGTQGFRYAFSASSLSNRTELQFLFAFDDDELKTIRSYEITVHSALFLTIPYDQLLKNKTEARSLERCSNANPSEIKTVIKPIIADVDVILRVARPLPDETLRKLRRKFAVDQQRGEPLIEYKLSTRQQLIALGISD
jgi:hypothetical protein